MVLPKNLKLLKTPNESVEGMLIAPTIALTITVAVAIEKAMN